MTRTIFMVTTLAIAFAAEGADFRPLLKAGIDLGGETLVTAMFTDGETEKIRANEGFYFGGGLAVIDAQRRLEFHATLGYKFAVINADNGELEWTRFPLEALAFYRFPRVRVGGGLAYHMSPRLEGDGVVGGLDVKFKNALGAVLQADWRISEKIAAGVRYTLIDYDAKGDSSGEAKANGLGVAFSMHF